MENMRAKGFDWKSNMTDKFGICSRPLEDNIKLFHKQNVVGSSSGGLL